MNANGITRGYMSKNMDDFKFLTHVIECLSREFSKKVTLKKLDDENYIVDIDVYDIKLSKEIINTHKNGYSLDKYILEEAERKGFIFDKFRSGYIMYCFGIK